MIIYLRRTKMLFIFAKNGLHYQFLSDAPLEENEAKLLHKYGFSLDDLRHKEEVEVVRQAHLPLPFVYELIEKRYNSHITMDDLWETLEAYYGSINRIGNWVGDDWRSSYCRKMFLHSNASLLNDYPHVGDCLIIA